MKTIKGIFGEGVDAVRQMGLDLSSNIQKGNLSSSIFTEQV